MNWVIEVEELLRKKRIFLEGTYEAEFLDLPFAKCKVLESIKVKMVAVITKDGIAVGGYAKTVVEHPCDRCLKMVKLPINGTIEALYKPISEAPKTKEEQLESLRNVIYYSSDKIDLSERIIEAIVVDVPAKVLCKPDCKGLCPRCGADLNEEKDHRCQEEDIDPRLMKLLKIKAQIQKEG
nr:DUF177 domain-containing protein [Pseudothermotoga thermarum]